jgi:CO/xanthine dehydrogenase Mo-binding subunit
MITQRGEYILVKEWLDAEEFNVVGKNVQRVDAIEKVLGQAKYVEDYVVEGMVYARIVKSPLPHGLIKGISPGEAISLPEFVGLVTARDIPGMNQAGYYIHDQPVLAYVKVRYHGEPVALAVAKSPEVAEEAVRMVELDIKELACVFDPLEALKDEVLVHEERGSNIITITRVNKGDVKEGFQASDVIVEDRYRTGYQDHAYLEPEGALAIPSFSGMTIITPNQSPHLVQSIVARVLGMKHSDVEVIQPAIGGSFGGKGDMGPIISSQAAIAAYKLRRPVLLVYTREDSFTTHCKRDPAIISYKSGASKEGKLMAIEVRIIFDAGAYANRGPFTIWRATLHATGPYHIPNVKVEGFLVYTNKVFQGSFRGFGNPQIHFAVESQMDELAFRLGMDPIDFRMKNLLRRGSTTLTHHIIEEDTRLDKALKLISKNSEWDKKRRVYGRIEDGRARGIGVACAFHGMGSSKGDADYANAFVDVQKDGSVLVFTGLTELGQGVHTGIKQIVAEVLGAPLDLITLVGGTSRAPNTNETFASRSLSIGGLGAEIAASKIRARMIRTAAKILLCNESEIRVKDGMFMCKEHPDRRLKWTEMVEECYRRGVEMSAMGYFYLPKKDFDELSGTGRVYHTYSYMAIIVEVEVDIRTGFCKVLKVWPAVAAGKIINPMLVEGQIHGGVIQGVGYTLMEEIRLKDGIILNPNFTDYNVPTIKDVPEIKPPIYVEDGFKWGAFGAKGVGELALNPVAAAIANAIKHATGLRPNEIPLTPEKLFFSLRRSEGA